MYFIDLRFKFESLIFEDDYLLKSLNTVTKYNESEFSIVEEFCGFLLNLEKSRSQQFKELLKDTKLKAIEVAHELPFALDEMFELEITALNQITMSNYRSYAELEKDLKLRVKNDLREWTNEIMEIKEQVKDRLRSLAKKSTILAGDLIRTESRNSKSLALSSEISRFNSLKSVFNYTYFGEENVPVSPQEVECWLNDVQRTLASLDQSAKNIVTLYKSIITVLFHRFLDELDDIKNTMQRSGMCHKKEIEDFKCEIYTPTVDQLNIEYLSELEDLQV
ncbi:uncharacterized protein LOC130440627 [Diorhabda sublineata]|uniref:uncharacterized protein LOC130440627 n=1 Tax=Diorhabda sublineata TaxID=1163346 RepID=UPI0024E06F2D|nr:uncharacterized protein LOC130440627 [Diorhabda sublineata]